MIAVDWHMALLGGVVGIVISAVFFIGLAAGMRYALGRENPVAVLSMSAVVRIFILLGVVWLLVQHGGPWAGCGFAVAFFVTRFIATTFARMGIPAGDAS
jgi:hypothetical protein